MFTDGRIAWNRRRLFVNAAEFTFGTTVTITNSVGAFGGLKLTSPSTTTEGAFLVPPFLDPMFQVGIRAHFNVDTTAFAAATFTPTFYLDYFTAGVALTATAATATAVGAAVATAAGANTPAPAGAKGYCVTNRALFNNGTLTRAQVLAGVLAKFSVLISSSVTIDATNFITLFGVEFDFVPMLTRAPHQELDCPFNDAGLS